MVAYLRLLPILGCLITGTARANALRSDVDEPQTGSNWGYVPGAYIVEYEDGHVS